MGHSAGMPKSNLADRAIAGLKVTGTDRVELWDEKTPGLGLRISEHSKVWLYRYRRPDGTQPRVRLGHYLTPQEAAGIEGALTIAGARTKARRLRSLIDAGRDPADERRLAKAEAKSQPIKTVRDLAEAFFEASTAGEHRPARRQKRASTIAAERQRFKAYIDKELGDVRVEAVGREAIKKLLVDLKRSGRGVTSNRVRSLLHLIFNYGVVEQRIPTNPVALVDRMVEEKTRERVIADDELRLLWACLDDPTKFRKPDGSALEVGRPIRLALALCLFTMARRGEIAGMRVSELDLENRTWTLPAGERTKSGRAHVHALSDTAVALLRQALALRPLPKQGEPDSPFVFPSPRDQQKSIDAGSISHAMRDIRAGIGVPDITVHDLRRSSATRLAQAGVSPFDIGQVLGHAGDRGGASAITFVYVRADFMPERRRAIETLEGLLMEIVQGSNDHGSKAVHS